MEWKGMEWKGKGKEGEGEVWVGTDGLILEALGGRV